MSSTLLVESLGAHRSKGFDCVPSISVKSIVCLINLGSYGFTVSNDGKLYSGCRGFTLLFVTRIRLVTRGLAPSISSMYRLLSLVFLVRVSGLDVEPMISGCKNDGLLKKLSW